MSVTASPPASGAREQRCDWLSPSAFAQVGPSIICILGVVGERTVTPTGSSGSGRHGHSGQVSGDTLGTGHRKLAESCAESHWDSDDGDDVPPCPAPPTHAPSDLAKARQGADGGAGSDSDTRLARTGSDHPRPRSFAHSLPGHVSAPSAAREAVQCQREPECEAQTVPRGKGQEKDTGFQKAQQGAGL